MDDKDTLEKEHQKGEFPVQILSMDDKDGDSSNGLAPHKVGSDSFYGR